MYNLNLFNKYDFLVFIEILKKFSYSPIMIKFVLN
jgi:hypothetical protein